MKKKRSKRTAFVPTVVFGTAVLGVIPACAIGCGGEASTKDASTDSPLPYVAAVGYCAFCDGPYWTVAAIGFDSGTEAGSEAGNSDAGDAAVFVADVAFGEAGDKG
jgi:hypothetical protein